MSACDDYPAGVPCWVDTLQSDVPAALGFYEAVFGWEFAGPGPMPDPDAGYYVARLRGRDVAGVGSAPSGNGSIPPAWNTYVSVASLEATVEAVISAGGAVLLAPVDALPAGRVAVITDPVGAAIGLWEGRDRAGAQLINEHSAWAMSLLQTTDTDAAAAFYADVFGWRADAIDMGGSVFTLFRLDGYVGGTPTQPVPRDVVAAMIPLDPASAAGGVIPHWAVDFWIADAEAAATVAPSRGGRVVLAAHDQPPFRRAVLADPAGAIFTVSTLMI